MFSFFLRAENAAGLIGLHSENRWALYGVCVYVRTARVYERTSRMRRARMHALTGVEQFVKNHYHLQSTDLIKS